MKQEIHIDFDPKVTTIRRFPSLSARVIEAMLCIVSKNESGHDYIQHRVIMKVVWKRVWPVTWCYVKYSNGDIKARAYATAIGFRKNMLGTAFMKALSRAGFNVSVNGEELKPWLVSERTMERIVRTVGIMFRKNDEFVACKKTCI